MISTVRSITEKIPEFCLSHWLFRVPLSIIFIQQALSKFPVTVEGAESFDLPFIVWWFAAYGELGGGLGLLVGGFLANKSLIPWLGDLLTRFSGITLCCIMTGVIWVGEPESLMDVLLYDYTHTLLWVGGLFFALRGNRS
ncbi:MAG: DoxX family membrane protein [Paracoccaceae bacterium]